MCVHWDGLVLVQGEQADACRDLEWTNPFSYQYLNQMLTCRNAVHSQFYRKLMQFDILPGGRLILCLRKMRKVQIKQKLKMGLRVKLRTEFSGRDKN